MIDTTKRIPISQEDMADMCGYTRASIKSFRDDRERYKKRYDAIYMGALCLKAGITPDMLPEIVNSGIKVIELAKKNERLEEALIDIGIKLEGIRYGH